MYFRSAEYFADPFSPQQRKWGLKSRDTFVRAATHMADRIEPIEVPFEGTTLPGYFMAPAGGAHDGRTVVVLTGFDGTGEELYFQAAVGGLARGFNVFICEGPGQVGCLRFHPELVFRPDYETPIAAMIDAALQRPEVAAERLALYGISFGGYFVIRACAHDRRIKALVANSPIVDLGAYLLAFIGIGSSRDVPPLKLSEVDAVPDSEFPPAMKLAFKSACPRFGVDTFASWIERLKDFTAVDGLDRIACPTLAMVGSGEGAAIAQAERYRDRVAGPASYRLFSEQEGADMHCQVGNLPLSCAVVYDWLAETFSR